MKAAEEVSSPKTLHAESLLVHLQQPRRPLVTTTDTPPSSLSPCTCKSEYSRLKQGFHRLPDPATTQVTRGSRPTTARRPRRLRRRPGLQPMATPRRSEPRASCARSRPQPSAARGPRPPHLAVVADEHHAMAGVYRPRTEITLLNPHGEPACEPPYRSRA